MLLLLANTTCVTVALPLLPLRLIAEIRPAVDGEVNVVIYAGIPMLRPAVLSVATSAVPAVLADVNPVLANTDQD
jgi:hypothetical protein